MEQAIARYRAMLRHHALSEHVLGAKPAWVFSRSGEEILWANAAGLAFLGIGSLEAMARYRLDPASPVAGRLGLLARRGGGGGLERFRFFVGARARPVACQCQTITLEDGETGVLAVAVDARAEPGQDTPGKRLLHLLDGAGIGAALLDGEGTVLAMTEAPGAAEGGSGEGSGLQTFGAAGQYLVVAVADDAATERSRPPAGESAPVADAAPAPDADPAAHGQREEETEPDIEDVTTPEPAGLTSPEAAPTPDEHGALRDPHLANDDDQAEDEVEDADDDDESLFADSGEDRAAPAPDRSVAAAQDRLKASIAPIGTGSLAQAIERLTTPLFSRQGSDGAAAESEPDRNDIRDGVAADTTADETRDPLEQAPDRLRAVDEIAPDETGFAFARRRTPHRFVWEMNADRRFTLVTEDLADAVGPHAATLVGRTWPEVAAEYGLDNDAIDGALERCETFTGLRVDWPVEGTDLAAPVELTALPIYDQSRSFAGYRGFGVCRTQSAQTDPAARGRAMTGGGTPRETTEGAGPGDSDDKESDQPGPVDRASPADAGHDRDHRHAPAPGGEGVDRDQPARHRLTGWAGAAISALGLSGRGPATGNTAEMPATAADAGQATMDSAGAAPALDRTGEAEPAFEAEPHQREELDGGQILALFKGEETSAEERLRFETPIEAPATPTDPGAAEEPAGGDGDREEASLQTDAAGEAPNDDLSADETPAVEPPAEKPPADKPPADQPAADAAAADAAPAKRTGKSAADEERLTELSRPEREAFLQIAKALGARVEDGEAATADGATPGPATPAKVVPLPSAFASGHRDRPESALIDRLPTGILVCRGSQVLFANRAVLDLLDYDSVTALAAAGGLHAIFPEDTAAPDAGQGDGGDRAFTVSTHSGVRRSVPARLYTVPWANDRALMIVFDADGDKAAAPAPAAEPVAGDDRVKELESILDTATDGVLVMTGDGVIQSVNSSAEALFGADRQKMIGSNITDYLAPESHRSALDYIDGLARNGVESVLNDGREMIGLESAGGLIPLFMTIGRIDKGDRPAKFCAVLRDITQWKKAEEDLTTARRQAENASSHKSDFLAKISHEIRTPLNAIIGFSEVMLAERLGPIGTERYKEYLNDIRGSGDYIMSLINDLLDLSKIEAGKMDLSFEAVSVNDILHNCVALLQPEANRERIIIRTSLSTVVPNVVADARSVQQIILNLLSNAIKFNQRGGQVIVSSSYTESGDVSVRVRDTGIGMDDDQLRLALEPFRQVQTSRINPAGTGLGLPLTKALVEANRASFSIHSKPREGTLVEIVFPSPRVLAE